MITIKVPLFSSNFVKLEAEKITCPEEVKLVFSSYKYSLKDIRVIVKKGDAENTYNLGTSKEIDISDLCKSAGKIEIEAQCYINGECVKAWRIESLVLTEIDGVFEAVPEIEHLQSELQTVKTAIKELIDIIMEHEYV